MSKNNVYYIGKKWEDMMKNMLNRLKKKQNKKGFTLVEIIVVLVILAILAAIAVPAVLGYIDDARKTQYIAEARSIYLVVQTEETKYKAERGYSANDSRFDFGRFVKETELTENVNNSGSEGLIYKKTGLRVTSIQDDTNGNYLVYWKSADNKDIGALIYGNKKIDIYM